MRAGTTHAASFGMRSLRAVCLVAAIPVLPAIATATAGRFFVVGTDGNAHPVSVPVPFPGPVAALATTLARRTGFRMTSATVTPLLPKDWSALDAAALP